MKKILITGITGFVGKHFATHLLSQNAYTIVGTYRSESSLEVVENIKDQIVLKKVDLNTIDAVEELILSEKPDYICHLAAQSSPLKSFSIPVETLTNNIVSAFSILDALRKHKLQNIRVLIISTGEMYGLIRPEDIPVDENTPFRPATPYAVSKLSQDFLSLQYYLAYNLDIVRMRPFNHIGPGQREGFVVADFAKQIAEIEAGKQDSVISVGNLDVKRDFTDVRDIVKAYELALQKGKSGDVYNIGSGKSQKIKEILDILLSFSSEKITVKSDPARFRPIDVPEIVCDSSKFHKLTNWQPSISFEKTLQDILDYWRKVV
ncbi:MAG TPA: GDP-mannose 4,6-dehydratase [Candidatus Sulfotelmatobacter sp.]|jgi:GDP-4-dehydro-6-deoxy-D-mannose reductase|nr:GDP-mannose 4,6-dehydratase [Candidatus Sulfotelmatobacter sp.]